MPPIGKSLIVLGLAIALVGAVLMVAPAIPGLGRLPGDISIRRGQFTVYFPFVTCIILSILATVVMSILRR